MIKLIVRSKRDAGAVKAMLRIFYDSWNIKVHTLYGERKAEAALRGLESIINYVLLLCQEDREMALELDKIFPPSVSLHVVPRAKIKNTRIEHLAHEFDIA